MQTYLYTTLTLSSLSGMVSRSIDSEGSGRGTAHAIQKIVAISTIASFILLVYFDFVLS